MVSAMATFTLLRRRHFVPLQGNRSCTLDIFRVETELTTGAAARVRYFEDVEVPAAWRKPITLKLPQDDDMYVDKFIQRFTDSKVSSGYTCCENSSLDTERKCRVAEDTHVDTCSSNDDLMRWNKIEEPTLSTPAPHNGAGPVHSAVDPAYGMTDMQRCAKKDLPIESIARYFHLPIHVAADQLKVGETWLKQKCREYDIKRWPYRKVKSLDKMLGKLRQQLAACGPNDAQQEAELRQQVREVMEEQVKIRMGQTRAVVIDPEEDHHSPAKRHTSSEPDTCLKKMRCGESQSPRYHSPGSSKLAGSNLGALSPLSSPLRAITNQAFDLFDM
uniref:RWP-RK domain-containing protein n=1 Tax=Tetraselmis chuii TaxID=63592 RepID=A0A7S1T3W8_9CHLO|mmetsp:Transcript_5144/g.9351  ORF Transcript_5144/g.9351 Transcript_5144/m.9351 type:complete len:331 (+) Transcript_5144:271-1263(+)